MIQDIFPHEFSNTFENISISENSLVYHVFENEIFLQVEKNTIQIPKFITTNSNARFLFKLDKVAYFFEEHSKEEKVILEKENPNGKWIARHALRHFEPKHLAFTATIALQLANWYRNNHFCGRCGAEMKDSFQERMLECPACHLQVFPKISPAVIIGIYNQNKILLTKYRNGPTTNYALVAGFCEIGETLEETVKREVLEEVGLQVKNITYYKSQPWPFTDTLLAGFFCELDGNEKITLEENELSLAKWFSRDEIPVEENAISLTNEMIHYFKRNPDSFL